MLESAHLNWVLKILERRPEELMGQLGVRMKELRELFPLAFPDDEPKALSKAINSLIA